MQFLSPMTIAIAAGLTIPPLVALYFLKLKRQTFAISSTLLWKKAIEDLHVNAPFQRLRNSLLLWLQLLVLALAAFALGKPMFAREQSRQETLILMIDQSASMAVVEDEDGNENLSRLDLAKREAKRVIDAMDANSRAMVIAFCDRATMVSSFDTDRQALQARIDSIEQTDSTSTLSEAITLAEAYAQNLIIGTSAGSDVAPTSTAPQASVLLFTDGRLADGQEISPQRLNPETFEVVRVGQRTDNVAILAMDAQRNYERPEVLQVFATVRNFSDHTVTVGAELYVDNEPLDVQTTELAAAEGTSSGDDAPANTSDPAPGSVASIAFDEIDFPQEGIIEVRLTERDALQADNRAWVVVPPPRRVDLLLVTAGNWRLERVIAAMDVNAVQMTPEEYEAADDDDLANGDRSRFDVVIFDNHSTKRLPSGNYMFWGAVPQIDGVEDVGRVVGESIIDWDDNHPILRHVSVGKIDVWHYWKRIKLPGDAVRLIEGESEDSPVLALLSRDASQYLICAFSFIVPDDDTGEPTLNTFWIVDVGFVTFMSDAIDFLASNVNTRNLKSARPGDPHSVAIPDNTQTVAVTRPDGRRENIPTAGAATVTYARTRKVGTYTLTPAARGKNTFAINLFDARESNIAPAETVVLGSAAVATTSAKTLVNEPLWPWLILAILAVTLIEWTIYTRRVAV
jgi:von Willebrand factor type A domain/Aerotolerance regulator N-terminal